MSTSAKTLIAAPVIYNELKDAEEKAIAVLGLLEDVIQPAFGDLRCDGGGESPPGAGEGGADRSTPPDQGRPTGHAGGATGGGEVAARAGIKR